MRSGEIPSGKMAMAAETDVQNGPIAGITERRRRPRWIDRVWGEQRHALTDEWRGWTVPSSTSYGLWNHD